MERVGELRTFQLTFVACWFLPPWWWRWHTRRFLQEPHGVTSQKTAFFTVHRENLESYVLRTSWIIQKIRWCERELVTWGSWRCHRHGRLRMQFYPFCLISVADVCNLRLELTGLITIELSLCLIKLANHCAMKTWGGTGGWTAFYLTAALEGDVRLASIPCRFNAANSTLGTFWLGSWVGPQSIGTLWRRGLHCRGSNTGRVARIP
jgi:hypothetical protein